MVLWTDTVPLLIYNDCPGTIWPGIYTTSGTGPGTGGFELAAGANKSLEVSTDWYGRIWGRTNCTSSGDDSLVCTTGSCGKMDCTQASVSLTHPRHHINHHFEWLSSQRNTQKKTTTLT